MCSQPSTEIDWCVVRVYLFFFIFFLACILNRLDSPMADRLQATESVCGLAPRRFDVQQWGVPKMASILVYVSTVVISNFVRLLHNSTVCYPFLFSPPRCGNFIIFVLLNPTPHFLYMFMEVLGDIFALLRAHPLLGFETPPNIVKRRKQKQTIGEETGLGRYTHTYTRLHTLFTYHGSSLLPPLDGEDGWFEKEMIKR